MKQNNQKAEKCGICFFAGEKKDKTIFTLVRTKDADFNERLLKDTYFRKK